MVGASVLSTAHRSQGCSSCFQWRLRTTLTRRVDCRENLFCYAGIRERPHVRRDALTTKLSGVLFGVFALVSAFAVVGGGASGQIVRYAPGRYLDGVSCSSSSACTAVGWFVTPANADRPDGPKLLAERWNGHRWSAQSTPNPPDASSLELTGVSCSSESACTAYGAYENAAGPQNLIERWNGHIWSLAPSPADIGLQAVSCVRRSGCEAVGFHPLINSDTTVLAEHWTGSRWTPQPSQMPAAGQRPSPYPGLLSVSCPTAKSCTAVGSVMNLSTGHPSAALAERWNGIRWLIETTPNPDGGVGLSSVSCSSAHACMATGAAASGRMISVRWNGLHWSLEPLARAPGGHASLSGVSCASVSACTGIGSYTDSSGHPRMLAERWNGTRWSIQRASNPGGGSAVGVTVAAASCPSASSCVAVGSYRDQGGARPLAEEWNGVRWLTLRPR
jgi:hypothetical protein